MAARPLHLPHLFTGSPEEVSRSIPCSRDGYKPLRRGKTFTFIIGHEYGCVNEREDSIVKDYEYFLTQLRTKLSEEEKLKEELKADLEKAMADLKRPWWKKLFYIK